jgi:hypothetical protein
VLRPRAGQPAGPPGSAMRRRNKTASVVNTQAKQQKKTEKKPNFAIDEIYEIT